MPRILKPEELAQKLKNLQKSSVPAVREGMNNASLKVKNTAREYCTPGRSPYYKAPYSDDRDVRRNPVHMRECIKQEVTVSGTKISGAVYVEDSAQGKGHRYALWVHEGSTRMRPRPFLKDAIKANDRNTRIFLSDAIYKALKKECV